MSSSPAPTALPHKTLAPQDAEVLLRLVHGPAGTAFKELAAPRIQESGEAQTGDLQAAQCQLLVGEYTVLLDSKNRFQIPRSFVDRFSSGETFLTASPEECLWLFPGAEFRRIYGELQDAINLSASALSLKTYFTSHSYLMTPDGQNRITVPPPLRSFLIVSQPKAPNRILLSGSGNFIEIWPLDKLGEQPAAREGGTPTGKT